MTIPTPESITSGWLTEQLHAAGHTDTEVIDFTAGEIGTGQIGKCVRYQLTLSDDSSAAPVSLVGKFPSDDPVSRGTGVLLRNYYREVRFYQELAESLPITTPRCYYADIVEEGPEFALLLEDMNPAVQGDQLTGCDEATARIAVTELVGLQAPRWCDSSLKEFDWLMEPADSPIGAIIDLYQQTLPGFIERYGANLAADQVEIISAVARSPDCPLFAEPGDTFCLEHVDYRLDNMLINSQCTPATVTVVDWQSIKVGRPLNDVAYFLGAGLVPETRREIEQSIVRSYHEKLQQAGIADFDWATCWEDYRRATFAGFAVTVIASMLVGQTKRGDEMFLTMADRHSRHALDLAADEFLK